MEFETQVWIVLGVLLALWVFLFVIVLYVCAKVKTLSKNRPSFADNNDQFQIHRPQPGVADSVYSFGKSNITPGEELSTRYTQPAVPRSGGGATPSKSLPPNGQSRYDYQMSSQQQRSMPNNNYNYPREPLSPRNNNNNFMY